tara:strand:- start:64 stop:645 length:582 start_codon:yes stop_codon:yes gene_type:complete
MLKLDGKTLQYDRAFTHEGISYPANWLRLTTLEEKQAIGISEVADNTQLWDQRFYWGVDNPKDLDQLKTNWKQQQSDIAGTLLAPSDWRVVKAAEVTAYSVESEWLTYRAAVRTSCNTRQTEIDACKDVPALKELLFGEPTITRQQTDSEGNGVVEPDTITVEGEEVTNPVAGQPVMETVTNPAIATAWPTPI